MTLEEALDRVCVVEMDEDTSPTFRMIGWYYVADEEGIRAYFENEADACFYRLALVNARLNPLK